MADALVSPRLGSDNEDGTKQEKERSKAFLEQVKTWDAPGVTVDKDTLHGRKANRGFTMSVGHTAPAAEEAPGRKDKRAQTLPASIARRGDFIIEDPEVTKKLQDMQKALAARYRRGSVTVASQSLVADEDMKKTFQEHTLYMQHGIMTEGQSHGDERERTFQHGDDSVVDGFFSAAKGQARPIVHCQKGSKGFRDTTPNQDNFSLTTFKNGWTLACAFDGHGPCGHIVSTRAVQTVPYFMALSEHFEASNWSPEKALIEAFERSQKELVAHSMEKQWDVQASGSTAVSAFWKDTTVYTANAGDSRCAIGTESDKTVTFATEDHKPTTEAEKARIEASGGEVRSQTYPDGWVNHRIFVKGENYPGLCMARTLGDQSVKDYGVIATPECAKTEVTPSKKPFFILASDGVWEFLDSPFVIKAVAKKIASDGPAKTLEKLQREAKKRWKQEEGDYCDDITSILVQLQRDA